MDDAIDEQRTNEVGAFFSRVAGLPIGQDWAVAVFVLSPGGRVDLAHNAADKAAFFDAIQRHMEASGDGRAVHVTGAVGPPN